MAHGRPDGIYGWVKLTGEVLAQTVADRFGISRICYRPFTVYGPGQDADYPMVRDFLHVDDAVTGILATHDQATLGGAMNLCTGIGTDFYAVATLAAKIMEYSPRIVGDASKPSGEECRVGSPELLRKWARPRTMIEDGLEAVLRG